MGDCDLTESGTVTTRKTETEIYRKQLDRCSERQARQQSSVEPRLMTRSSALIRKTRSTMAVPDLAWAKAEEARYPDGKLMKFSMQTWFFEGSGCERMVKIGGNGSK